MSYQQVTYIDDLPELNELGGSTGPDPFQRATQQSIHQSPHAGAGMGSSGMVASQQAQIANKFIRLDQSPLPEEAGMSMGPMQMPMPPAPAPAPVQMPMYSHSDEPSCLSVANHVENCPICSKLFKTDQTIMIIALVVLSILCLLLLKRVLNL